MTPAAGPAAPVSEAGGDATVPALRWTWLGTVAYEPAWELQRELATARRDGSLASDAVLLLEHPPVYTLGRNTLPEHVPVGPDGLRSRGAACHSVDRGGSVTFHGPGQLVAYPIVLLADVFPIASAPRHGDVLRYLRALEDALCATCRACGVAATPAPPYTGAWVGDEKIAAIGVKLSRGVTQHGVALNVNTDLGWFEPIVPCGIAGRGVTSLDRLGARGHSPASLAPLLAALIAAALGRRLVAGLPRAGPVAAVA
ncbi:MAG TPA: lipoyl(octanoyl) transferase LipB [Candidatus Dormibacteraeota bacterium]